MVQEYSPRRSHASYLNEALAKPLSQGLSEFISSWSVNKDLDKIVNDPSLKNAPVSERLSKLQSSLTRHGPRGQQVFQNRMAIEQQGMKEKEQQKNEAEQEILGKFGAGEPISAQERKKLSPKTQIELQKLEKNKKQASGMKDALKKANVPDELADQFGDLYESATEGGKTELLKQFNELFKRGKTGYFKDYNKQNAVAPNAPSPEDLEWPEIPQPEGMTPSEEVKLQGNREKLNSSLYEEVNAKVGGNENEARAVDRLTQLNESGKLPEGLEKWDINWETGEPRFSPGTLPPEAQLFIKTINDFTVKAKDTFGSRVTNFDLQAFMKRLPTLANSSEGRKLILKQMEISNKIANLKDETLIDAFDHYGLGGASNQQIRKIANDKYKEQKKVLEGRLKNLDGLLDDEYQNELMKPKENIPQGNVKVRSPDGKMGSIPQDKLEAAMKAGYERIQ